MTPTIDLYSLQTHDLGLIIEYPSGVFYSNQAGGVCCRHPSVEGVFIPLGDVLVPEHAIVHLFEAQRYQGLPAPGLDLEDADRIDEALSVLDPPGVLTVDRQRLQDSQEAWVHVLLHRPIDDTAICNGFDPYPRRAVLVWGNSD